MAVCGLNLENIKPNKKIDLYPAGDVMRKALRHSSPDTVAAIGDNVVDVSPLNLAAALKQDCPSRKIVLATEQNSGSFASRAKSAGVSDLIGRKEFLSLLASLSVNKKALCAVQNDIQKPLTISFVSGRGGVGKSTLAIALSMIANSSKKKVALIDADIQFPDLEFLCASDHLFQIVGMKIMGIEFPQTIDSWDTSKILLVKPSVRSEYSDSANDMVRSVAEQLNGIADVIFVNTGSYWVDLHAQIIDISDICLMVMDQRASSVKGCKIAGELCSRMGFPSSKFAYVLNNCSAKSKFNAYDCAMSLGVNSVLEARDGGMQISEAYSLGIPSSLLGTGNSLLDSTVEIFDTLMLRMGLDTDSSCAQQLTQNSSVSKKRKKQKRRSNVSISQG